MTSTSHAIVSLGLVAALLASTNRANAEEQPQGPTPAAPVTPQDAPAVAPPPPPEGATPPAGAATPPLPPGSAVPTAPPPPLPGATSTWQPPPPRDWTPYRVYTEDVDSDGKPQSRQWYGWQTLIVMGVSTPLMLAFGAGLAGFTFGGPIVHWAHGNVGKGFGALGLNLGLTMTGGLLGWGLTCAGDNCRGDFGGLAALAGIVIGGGVGLLTANIIDVAALSYETPEPSDERSARRRPPRLTIAPKVGVSAHEGYLGVLGAF